MSLQQQLEQIAASLPEGKLGIFVKAVRTGQEWAVSADERYPLASVLKVPVLVEFYRQIQIGEIRLEERMELTADRKSPGSGILQELDPGLQPTLQDLALLMIIRSDNTATDMVISRVGLGNVNRSLDRLGLHETRVTMDCRTLIFNAFDLAEPGRPGRAEQQDEYLRRVEQGLRRKDALTYSDSLENNVGTPRELGRLLELILAGQAFDPAGSEAALAVLKRQQIRDRLPRLLPPEAELAHKTGSIGGVRNDVGILFTQQGPVIVACLSKGAWEHEEEASQAISRVGLAVWEHFAQAPHQS